MIVKEYNIQESNLHYFIGINQIKIIINKFIDVKKIDNKAEVLNQFFKIIKQIQNKYENSVIQFIKNKYLLNEDHIFTACYYLQKAFLQNKKIANNKNIELLLYLAANRQISKSLEGFGIDYSDLSKGKLTYCIISPKNNLNNIYINLSEVLCAEDDELTINNESNTKSNLIKEYFEISDNQVDCVLKSYGFNISKSDLSLNSVNLALYDLICEKMALLYVEGAKNI